MLVKSKLMSGNHTPNTKHKRDNGFGAMVLPNRKCDYPDTH